MKWKCAIAGAAMAMVLAPAMALADSSIGGVENARAKERQGSYLTRQDRENLRRYGGNDDYGYGYGYGYGPYGNGDGYDGGYYADDHYDTGPGVGIYLGY
jgi:hypothetical protein